MPLIGSVLDANVLVPAPLRDVLLRSAEADLYRAHWTDAILEEVKRAVVEHRMADHARAQRLIDRMRDAFPEAEVYGHELAPARLVQIVREQSSALRHPPLTADQVLASLAVYAPHFVRLMRGEINGRLQRG